MLFYKGRKVQHSQGGAEDLGLLNLNGDYSTLRLEVEPKDKFSMSLVLFPNTTFYVLQREV